MEIRSPLTCRSTTSINNALETLWVAVESNQMDCWSAGPQQLQEHNPTSWAGGCTCILLAVVAAHNTVEQRSWDTSDAPVGVVADIVGAVVAWIPEQERIASMSSRSVVVVRSFDTFSRKQ